ncbi:MAG TPA: sigma-54 dependent transcriptional regulator [Terriglobales bacterium]|nr:sigma-54 dependent transcriptional regulator [Terriglobales bacterium]
MSTGITEPAPAFAAAAGKPASHPAVPGPVLLVDDEPGMRAALAASFRHHGWQVETACGVSDAVACFRRRFHPLVVTDMRMPDGDGFAVMREVRSLAPQTAVILLTAFASVPDAVAAMKSGACDYLTKPVAFEPLQQAARRVLERSALPAGEGELVGHSALWLRALARARQAAASDADVLIQAESGTGKELVARLIHRLSPRRARPFVAINCAAFPESLLESELFGHTKGAFTGALASKPGKFELAHGGTLLLDEVGEMPLALQPKLLRALQEREFDRLGDTRAVKVDIRILATTNRLLETMVREGGFRADLYYRLKVIPLSLPPLRERPEDIAELAAHFARLYAPAGAAPRLAPELVARLEEHAWPGNVRELANLMRRAVAWSGGEIGPEALAPEDLPGFAGEPGGTEPPDRQKRSQEKLDCLRAGLSLEQMERRLLEVTLEATAGNRSRAAQMLGVSLRTVRNKIRGYGLPPRRSYGRSAEASGEDPCP